MKRLKKLSGKGIWIAAAVSLAVCSLIAAAFKPVVIRIAVIAGSGWDVPSPDGWQIIEKAVELFSAENPKVKIVLENGLSDDDYADWLAGEIATGNAPDLFMILPGDFELYYETGALKCLDYYLSMSEMSPEDFYSGPLLAGQVHGKQYALPFESNVELLFANQSLLDTAQIELPENLDLSGFKKICQAATQDTDHDGRIDQFGIPSYTWKQAADAYGLQIFNENGTRADLTSRRFVQALEYAEAIQNLAMGQEYDDLFFEGKAAFNAMSFADYRTYTPLPWKIKRQADFEWNVMPMPALEDGIADVDTIQFGISSKTSHAKLCWQLLHILCMSEEIQNMIYTHSQGISPLRSAEKEMVNEIEVDYSLLESVMERPTRSARFSRYENTINEIDWELEQIDLNHDNLDLKLSRIEEKINRTLNS